MAQQQLRSVTSGLSARQCAVAAGLVGLPWRGLLSVHGVDRRSCQSLRFLQCCRRSLRDIGGVWSYGSSRWALLLVG